jgi:hypothetical protein
MYGLRNINRMNEIQGTRVALEQALDALSDDLRVSQNDSICFIDRAASSTATAPGFTPQRETWELSRDGYVVQTYRGIVNGEPATHIQTSQTTHEAVRIIPEAELPGAFDTVSQYWERRRDGSDLLY